MRALPASSADREAELPFVPAGRFGGMPLDPQLATLLDLVNAAEKKMHEGTPAEARAAFRTLTVDFVKPEDVVPVGSVEDLTVAGRPARLYRPEGAGETPTLVFFHGGGYVIGDLDTHDPTCRRICRGAEVTVLAIDYRLAPEHPFPAAVEDAIAATRWAAEHLPGTRLAVGGDSAGGNLSAVVAQALPDLVQAQVLLYPAVDAKPAASVGIGRAPDAGRLRALLAQRIAISQPSSCRMAARKCAGAASSPGGFSVRKAISCGALVPSSCLSLSSTNGGSTPRLMSSSEISGATNVWR